MYIKITTDDVEFISNRSVICFDCGSFTLFEPILPEFENRFKDYKRYAEDTEYVYVIIPSELIPSLTELSNLVADIDVQNQFNVVLSTTEIITREGVVLNVPSDILNMTPCKCLTWENGDDELLQGIIDVWNSQEDYRIIEFPCKFDSLADLEAFKAMQL